LKSHVASQIFGMMKRYVLRSTLSFTNIGARSRPNAPAA